MTFWHRIATQFRRPSGLLGRIAGCLFRMNREGIDWTVGLLEIQSSDYVLEIGFGSGHGIESAATQASQGKVFGIDASFTMLSQAAKRNAAAMPPVVSS